MSTPLDKQRFDVSLEDLQTFLIVADLGSFSRAADQLHLSQPSISNRVRRLEEKLTVRLLNRTTRRVELTPYGERLYVQASATLNALRATLQDFHSEAQLRRRELNIAATLMVATVALPPLVRSFANDHPDIILRIQDRRPEEIVEALNTNTCDLAVMMSEWVPADLSFKPLTSDRCVVVTPRNHPLLARKSATLAEVLAYPILSLNGQVALREAIEAEAASRGLDVRLAPGAWELSSVITMLAMTAAGLGICIHPRSLIPTEFMASIGTVDIEDTEIRRTYGIVTNPRFELSRNARLFRDFLAAQVPATGGWPAT